MSEAKNQQAEPSMEEILASIRRIISEDSDAGKAPPAAAPAAPTPAPAAAPAPAPAAPPAPAPAPAEILELTEMVGDDGKVTKIEEKPAPPPAPPLAPAPAPAEAADGDELVSNQTAAAAMGALAGLQAATKKSEVDVRGAMPIGNGAATLEDIVRAEMRPILKAWLDENLPGLVERLVQKEIKRITRQVEET